METVKSSREIERMFATGTRAAHPLLIVIATRTSDERGPGGRVAFVAGKKLGGAVVRNRAKRVLREAARLAGAPWPGHDVALIARPALPGSSPADVRDVLRVLLRKTGVCS